MSTNVAMHPYCFDLIAQWELLSVRLAQSIQQQTSLEYHIVPALYADYERNIGVLEIRSMRQTIRSAEMQQRAEMLRHWVQRGDTLTPVHFQAMARAISRAVSAQKNQLAFRLKVHRRRLTADPALPPAATEQLNAVLRKLIRALHPDVVGEITPLYRRYWIAIEAAFREGNLPYIETLYIRVKKELAGNTITRRKNDIDWLKSRISQMQIKRIAYARRIATIKALAPSQLAEPSSDVKYAQERQGFSAEIARQTDSYDRAASAVAELTGRLKTSVSPRRAAVVS